MTAWDTDLGPVAPPVETADEAFAREIALAHAAVEGEVCDDERDADAAVGVMPIELLAHVPAITDDPPKPPPGAASGPRDGAT